MRKQKMAQTNPAAARVVAKHCVRPSWVTGLSGLSALICMSLTTAFDMPCLRSPLWLGASASTQLRRRPLVQFGPEAALMCLRGGRPLTPRSGIAALTWGHAVRKCDARVSSRTNGLFLSLRMSESLHGGGIEREEETVAIGVEEGAVGEAGARQTANRRKRTLTAEEEEERQQRRAKIAQQRADRLAKIASGETGLGKVRQHVNPLSPAFRDPIPTPNWAQVYSDTSLPLHVDMGCGKGRMLLEMAKLHPERNFLGVEIREPLVARADRWVREERLRNLHYVSGNINVSVESVLATYPGHLDLVSILMPDPWFKNRHKKRRLLQPELISQLAQLMQPGARVFVMSDVEDAARDMVDILGQSAAFGGWEEGSWCESPLPLKTEREASCMSRGEPIFRAVFTRV